MGDYVVLLDDVMCEGEKVIGCRLLCDGCGNEKEAMVRGVRWDLPDLL